MKTKEDWLLNNPHCKQIESCSKSLSKKCICPKEESKQETLEEAAKENFKGEYVCNGIDIVPAWREGFIVGAKWQQERMYSEEEVIEILNEFSEACYWPIDKFEIPEWLEKIKNK